MLRNFKKNHQSGFTIIEVLIVLAIAGLIMVAVFTAVPALQRSSRNNQRKSAASQIMASVSSYVANNNGTLPVQATLSAALSDYKPGFYLTTDVLYGTFANPGTSTIDNAIFVSGAACNLTNTGIVAGASSRSYAVLYNVETGSSGVTPQCIGS